MFLPEMAALIELDACTDYHGALASGPDQFFGPGWVKNSTVSDRYREESFRTCGTPEPHFETADRPDITSKSFQTDIAAARNLWSVVLAQG